MILTKQNNPANKSKQSNTRVHHIFEISEDDKIFPHPFMPNSNFADAMAELVTFALVLKS